MNKEIQEILKYYKYAAQCRNPHCKKIFGTDLKNCMCPYCYRKLKKRQQEQKPMRLE